MLHFKKSKGIAKNRKMTFFDTLSKRSGVFSLGTPERQRNRLRE